MGEFDCYFGLAGSESERQWLAAIERMSQALADSVDADIVREFEQDQRDRRVWTP